MDQTGGSAGTVAENWQTTHGYLHMGLEESFLVALMLVVRHQKTRQVNSSQGGKRRYYIMLC
jgi:hypothetical protein